ncbi:MAG: multidrug efflux pump subunit AcrA (membrane-fusion protein) [Cocleimonas sp.]|jgi:multidrug efflux pump subunit AcrA (membrane-fusion protein)
MLKIIIPITVLIGAVFFGKFLISTGPEAKKRPFVQRMPVVEVLPLKAQEYTIYIQASGIVTAGTESDLVAEVSGRVVSISDNFNEGSYFDKGEVLLQIDPSNYRSAVDIAKSELEVNRASLKQLKAEEKSNLRSIQLAKKNLNIGNKELARLRALFKRRTISRSALDSEEQRINQLQQSLQNLQGSQNTYASRKIATQARINSSKARINQESLTLSRATIKAPYAGRVLTKNADIGQFVTTGSMLAETYATEFVNVEIPLSLNQYELLGMPEAFKNKKISSTELPTVRLTNADSIRKDSWLGQVVRTGAALDAQSRQINVIVRVDNPYEAREGISSPIRIGQYLKARIKGKTFNNVYALPPVGVIYNREIRLLKDGKIKIVPIEVIWNSTDATVIQTDRNIEGEQLILTNLAQAVNGMSVLTLEEQRKQNKDRAKKQKMQKRQKEEQSKVYIEERKKSRIIPDVISRDSMDKTPAKQLQLNIDSQNKNKEN